ncbi:hypothetical protein P2318_24980 [Myxococcaceae bacterium GXIMD 01537]
MTTESTTNTVCDIDTLQHLPPDPLQANVAQETASLDDVGAPPEVEQESAGFHALSGARNAAAGVVGYSRFVLNVVPFAAANQALFTPQHLQELAQHVQEVVNWLNIQIHRVAPNVSFVHDNGAQRLIRSKRPLAWFQGVNADVLSYWKPYPALATESDVKEYNTQPASRQRWWMNVLADLSNYTQVHLGGRTQVQPTVDVGKSMALHSRTVVLCAFGTPPNNGGAVAPARTAMISQDGLGPPTPAKAGSVIAHEFLHTTGLRDLTADRTNRARDAKGNDIDIMGGAMHDLLAKLAIGPDDLRQLRDENRSQYRSGFAPHSLLRSMFGPNMPDWDTIQVTEQRGACPPDRIRITLTLGQGITWWKGLMLCRRDRSGTQALIDLQDNNRTATVEVRPEDLRTNDLVLGKAKVFGIHTNMYCVEDASISMRGGNAYTFTWVKD